MYGPDPGYGAHPIYHDSGRCPVCRVPLQAPHMNSCDYTGVWHGQEPPAAAHDDDWDDEDD